MKTVLHLRANVYPTASHGELCVPDLPGRKARSAFSFVFKMLGSAFWKELHQITYLNKTHAYTLAEVPMNSRQQEGRAWFVLFQGFCAS